MDWINCRKLWRRWTLKHSCLSWSAEKVVLMVCIFSLRVKTAFVPLNVSYNQLPHRRSQKRHVLYIRWEKGGLSLITTHRSSISIEVHVHVVYSCHICPALCELDILEWTDVFICAVQMYWCNHLQTHMLWKGHTTKTYSAIQL